MHNAQDTVCGRGRVVCANEFADTGRVDPRDSRQVQHDASLGPNEDRLDVALQLSTGREAKWPIEADEAVLTPMPNLFNRNEIPGRDGRPFITDFIRGRSHRQFTHFQSVAWEEVRARREDVVWIVVALRLNEGGLACAVVPLPISRRQLERAEQIVRSV